ncbi:unnamed protein product [Didymodactylos carnosus]|uniref:Uncharacterized protein n=1 Tax=Didymodactylos carnosus TaxID=1234261 RepID=A0A815NM49_9BILA|nr:unnamed protein product [Didymodactylos carnosus]CAF1431528.1 unnamed protein product [Didymodactylos carnosus]CAF4099019.1 unnamed protein product [Didymodactylos carnosus]CAF4310115.1 unnamed protein product [Didymodactylos carnosus]
MYLYCFLNSTITMTNLFDLLRTHIINGSIIEGQAYSKYQCDGIPDINLMIEHGEINSQDELIPTSSIPGFVYVKWNSTTLGKLPYQIHPLQNIRCIYQLSNDNKRKSKACIDYYLKHKHTIDAKLSVQNVNALYRQYDDDYDCVPSLKLNFWPKDVKSSLERIKQAYKTKKPLLFDKLNSSYMHVIQKWSTKSDEKYKNIEFRYSFSNVEKLLAHERTLNEKILNGIARSIFYKYLYKKGYIPSYFIKTTVLWMCELYDFRSFDDTNYDTLAQTLGAIWIDFACDQLKSYTCEHYFIHGLNILELYPKEILDESRKILENDAHKELDTLHSHSDNEDDISHKQFYFVGDLNKGMDQLLLDEEQAHLDYIELESMFYSSSDKRPGILDHLVLLQTLAASDGEENNWLLWKKLFLDDSINLLPPIREEEQVHSLITFMGSLGGASKYPVFFMTYMYQLFSLAIFLKGFTEEIYITGNERTLYTDDNIHLDTSTMINAMVLVNDLSIYPNNNNRALAFTTSQETDSPQNSVLSNHPLGLQTTDDRSLPLLFSIPPDEDDVDPEKYDKQLTDQLRHYQEETPCHKRNDVHPSTPLVHASLLRIRAFGTSCFTGENLSPSNTLCDHDVAKLYDDFINCLIHVAGVVGEPTSKIDDAQQSQKDYSTFDLEWKGKSGIDTISEIIRLLPKLEIKLSRYTPLPPIQSSVIDFNSLKEKPDLVIKTSSRHHFSRMGGGNNILMYDDNNKICVVNKLTKKLYKMSWLYRPFRTIPEKFLSNGINDICYNLRTNCFNIFTFRTSYFFNPYGMCIYPGKIRPINYAKKHHNVFMSCTSDQHSLFIAYFGRGGPILELHLSEPIQRKLWKSPQSCKTTASVKCIRLSSDGKYLGVLLYSQPLLKSNDGTFRLCEIDYSFELRDREMIVLKCLTELSSNCCGLLSLSQHCWLLVQSDKLLLIDQYIKIQKIFVYKQHGRITNVALINPHCLAIRTQSEIRFYSV